MSTSRRRWPWAVAVASLLAASVGACGGDDDRDRGGGAGSGDVDDVGDVGDGASSPTGGPRPCVADETPTLRADLVDDAVAAVEAELGPGRRYYEINATPALVNLFVAGEGEGSVVPYVFVEGALTPGEPIEGATGSTFTAEALTFDPSLVTSCVEEQLGAGTLVVFEVLGGPGGAVQYSVVTRSVNGGQLIATVDPTGRVQSVDTVT